MNQPVPAARTYRAVFYGTMISRGTARIMVCSWRLLIPFASMAEEKLLSAVAGNISPYFSAI